MKKVIKLVLLLSIASLVACDESSQNTATKNTAQVVTPSVPKKPPLKVTEWAYAVPLQGISTVNVWKKAGAKSTPQNQVVATLNESTRVGILGRKALNASKGIGPYSPGSIYFHIELEDGKRGFVGRPFISRDVYGNAFYEQNSLTGTILRDGTGYTFSRGANCILHVAALMTGDLRKGEFETTAEFEKRKSEVSATIPWFSNNITYAYVYEIAGQYDADKQIFVYDHYRLPEQKGEDLEFDYNCRGALGYQESQEDYRTKRAQEKLNGTPETLLKIMGATLPNEFVDTNYTNPKYFKVRKRIARADAPRFKNTKLFIGVRPKTINSVKKGIKHSTRLGGDVSYIFLITADGKEVVESYVSGTYKNTWQRDLQSQLVIAGYDQSMIDGFAGDATNKALESAVADGILPNPEVSMRSTMMLIEHNRKAR